MRTTRAWILATLIATTAPGCGLGTEVGNGEKPKGGTDSGSAKKQDSGEPDQQPEKTTAQNTPKQGADTSAPGTVTANGGGSSAGAANSTTPAAAAMPADPSKALGFDINLLFTSCASPLGASLEMPEKIFTLAINLDAASGRYSVKDASATLDLEYVLDTSKANTIKVYDSAGLAKADVYTCGAIAHSSANGTDTYTVDLTPTTVVAGAPAKTTVAWTTGASCHSGAVPRVTSVTVTPDKATPITEQAALCP